MQQHLHKFLVLHRTLSIPGLGSFTIDNEPARFDVPSGLLFAPKPVIHFGETVLPVPEKTLYDFLSEEMGVDETVANQAFNEFAERFRNDVQEHRLGLLPGVGRLTRGSDGGLYFTQESNLLELLPPVQVDDTIRKIPADSIRVPAKKQAPEPKKKPVVVVVEKEPALEEPVTTEELEEETEEIPRDRWWIYALILLAAAALALLFYYQ
jgi:hypothetical protein